jgi:predicted TIM-barrel fold metal-dependent hydrolase
MRIDVHAHYYPPAYLEVLERAYAHPATPREIGVRRILDGKIRPTPAMSRLDDRLAEMDRYGVDMQVLSVSIPQAYHADRATAVAMAQAANDGTAEACRRYPARFKGFASLPLPHVDAALDELARAIDQLGLHGVVLGGNVLQEPLDKPAFAPLFDEINRRNLAVFIHPMVPCGVECMQEYDLAAAVGYMLDSCLAALRLVYSGTCERCPNLRPILCHAGGYLPFQWERLNASYYTRPEARERISRPPTEYLKRFFYDNANFHVPALRCALETVGASQLMLGSDYPFGLGDIGKMVSSFEALGLGPEDRARVESGNALSVLR